MTLRKLIVNIVVGVIAAVMIIGPAFAHGGGLDTLVIWKRILAAVEELLSAEALH